MEAYKDETLSFKERAKDLVSRMTLDEKISQMRFRSPSIERLGIPSYTWWNESLHGVARSGVATVFPQAIGLAATFNPGFVEKVADVIATEGRARYHALDKENDHDIYKGLTFWAPNVNIFRDPRWGRGHETYGEDPYLTAEIGVAYVRGIQGNDEKYLKAAACAKHFAVHSGPESLRHEFNAVESGDKPDLNLPGEQQKLLEAVHATGTPVILVLMAGSALAVNWADENVPAIIDAWYPGAQGGRAVASLLFGEYSPSGKLPVTFYRSSKELPDFKDYSMENRTYKFMKNKALYPFGYGLSYSKFELRDLTLSKTQVNAGEPVELSLTIENKGDFEADEVVQIYIKDMEASTRVPNWQLYGIKNVHLKPSESMRVSAEITPRAMALIDDEGNCVLEPGKFTVYTGTSQPDSRSEELTGQKVLSAMFEVTGEKTAIEY